MRTLVHHLLRWLADAWAGWNDFWFRPSDPATLGLIRILAGGMMFYTHLVWSLDLMAFFGADGWLSPAAVGVLQQRSYAWSYLWLVSSPAALWTVHIAALGVFLLLTLGLFSRVTSVLAAVAVLSYVSRAPGALFGLDQINLMLALYLAVGRCGDAYSLDRLLRKRRALRAASAIPQIEPSVGANVAIRLIQLHMCVIYAFAGTSKLMGASWWDGTAMWQAFASLEYQSLDMTWMARWPRAVNFLTHVTIVWEVYYCALIWPRSTRPWMLALAVPLHLGIGMCLGMMTFGIIMLVGNMAFLPPEVVRGALAWRPWRQTATMPQAALESEPAQPQRRSRKQRVQHH